MTPPARRSDIDGHLRALVTASSAQERALIEEAIVIEFSDLSAGLARRYHGRGIDDDDLHGAANLGLVKAIRGFHPDRGSFPAYAKATIDGELKKHFRDFGWSIRPPRSLQELRPQVLAVIEAQRASGLDDSAAAVADLLGVPASRVHEVLTLPSCYRPSSLDVRLGEDSDDALGNHLAAHHTAEADYDDHDLLARSCIGLSDADHQLIRLRHYEELRQDDIATLLGISQIQVSRRLRRLHARILTSLLPDTAA